MHGLMSNRKIIFILCILLLVNIFTGCKKYKSLMEQKVKINAYISVKDKDSLDLIKYLLDEYSKKKSNVEITYNNVLGENSIDKDIVNEKMDMLFITRNEMLDLCKKGLLMPMKDFYVKSKIDDNYYNIVKDYGRVGDNYYGLGLMPYSLEFIYSKSMLSRLKVGEPSNINQIVPVINKMRQTNKKVPVFLNDDITIAEALASVAFSNSINMMKIEESYDSNYSKYAALDVQSGFQAINNISKQARIPLDTFEKADEMEIQKLKSGDTAMVIAASSILPKMYEESSYVSDIDVVKDFSITAKKSNVPVIVNCVTSIPANSKKQNEVSDIFEFIYSQDTQKKLAEKNYVTGNKKVNDEVLTSSPMDTIKDHIELANENSIFYIYEIPKKLRAPMESAVENIINGSYTGKEWNQILEKVYK